LKERVDYLAWKCGYLPISALGKEYMKQERQLKIGGSAADPAKSDENANSQ
jgi:hypothetical protein